MKETSCFTFTTFKLTVFSCYQTNNVVYCFNDRTFFIMVCRKHLFLRFKSTLSLMLSRSLDMSADCFFYVMGYIHKLVGLQMTGILKERADGLAQCLQKGILCFLIILTILLMYLNVHLCFLVIVKRYFKA